MKHVLHTKRLDLVPFSSVDTDLFLQLNTTPFVRAYLWDGEIISATTAEEIIRQNHEHFRKDNYGLWKIRFPEKQQMIGYAGLWDFFGEPQPQLIYALAESYTRKGYATEAGARIIQYAFEELGFKYLLAAMDEPHLASQQVARRLGMALLETRSEQGKPTVFYRIENDRK